MPLFIICLGGPGRAGFAALSGAMARTGRSTATLRQAFTTPAFPISALFFFFFHLLFNCCRRAPVQARCQARLRAGFSVQIIQLVCVPAPLALRLFGWPQHLFNAPTGRRFRCSGRHRARFAGQFRSCHRFRARRSHCWHLLIFADSLLFAPPLPHHRITLPRLRAFTYPAIRRFRRCVVAIRPPPPPLQAPFQFALPQRHSARSAFQPAPFSAIQFPLSRWPAAFAAILFVTPALRRLRAGISAQELIFTRLGVGPRIGAHALQLPGFCWLPLSWPIALPFGTIIAIGTGNRAGLFIRQ